MSLLQNRKVAHQQRVVRTAAKFRERPADMMRAHCPNHTLQDDWVLALRNAMSVAGRRHARSLREIRQTDGFAIAA